MTQATRITHSSLDVNIATFRDWQDLPREVYEILGNRVSLGNFLVYGFHKDILDRHYRIVDEEDEPQHEDMLTVELMDDVNEKYAKALKAKKQYGLSVLSYYKLEGEKERTLWWLEDTHIYDMETLVGTKQFSKLSFVPPYYDRATSTNTVDVPDKELDNFRLLAEYDTKFDQYRSWLEPIADRLVGWAIMFQQLTLLQIRDGSGIRYIMAPASHLADPEIRTRYENILENFGLNTLLMVPDNTEIDSNFQFGLKFAEGQSSVNYGEAMDMILVPIALYSGHTKEYLKGNEKGMRSAEKNRQRSNDTERKEERKMSADLAWVYGKILDCDDCLEGRHSVSFEVKEELDQMEYLEILEKAFGILNNTNLEALGMQLEDVLEKMQIDIPIDQAMIEQYKTQREELRARVEKSMTEDNDSDTDEEIQGEEEPPTN